MTKIPYKPYFSFGEKITSFEESGSDPGSLTYAYTTLSAVIADGLNKIGMLQSSRENFVQLFSEPQLRTKKKKHLEIERNTKIGYISQTSLDGHYEEVRWTNLLQILEGELAVQTANRYRFVDESFADKPSENINEQMEQLMVNSDFVLVVITPSFI